MSFVFAYITAPTVEDANRIGRKLVEERLAACVNIIPGMSSLYWWENKIEEATETIVIAKTTEEHVPELTRQVKAMHSYDCPCVVTLPVTGGNPDYMRWLGAETELAERAHG